jgi:hypothetical protein
MENNPVVEKEQISDDEIVIGGQKFSRAEVEETGKRLAKRKANKLRWTGAAFLSAGATFLLLGIVNFSAEGSPALVVIGAILFILGAIFFPVSFKRRDPIRFGTRYYLRQLASTSTPAVATASGPVQAGILTGRIIQLSRKPLVRIIFDGNENKIQIFSEKKYSRIYSKQEVIDYELRVDNEVVVTSSSRKGMGKAIAMGAIGHKLFGSGGAGMMAGSLAASQKTSSSQKEVHHYTLLIKVKDINKASYYMPIDTVQLAEEVITILDMIIGKGNPKEIEEEHVEEKPTKNEEKVDKFAEIKKYKDLLDSGIITQEEFDKKKSELL